MSQSVKNVPFQLAACCRYLTFRESKIRLRRLSRFDYQDHPIDRSGYTKRLSRPPQRRAIDQDKVEV
jgi:hypothetical protein